MTNQLAERISRLATVAHTLRTSTPKTAQDVHYQGLYHQRIGELASISKPCDTLAEVMDVLDLHAVPYDEVYRGEFTYYFNVAHDFNVASWFPGFPVIVHQSKNFPHGRRDATPPSERYPVPQP